MEKHNVTFSDEPMNAKNIQIHLRVYNRLLTAPADNGDPRKGTKFIDYLEEVFGRRSKEYSWAESYKILQSVVSALPSNDTQLWEATP